MEKDKSKYSAASKARWSRFTQEERSERMRIIAKKKWSVISPEERLKHAMLMVNSRKINV